MLNLHAPFRLAEPRDAQGVTELAGRARSSEGAVVAEEGGRVVAALAGEPAGETWRLDLIAVPPDRLEELGPRLLAIADALAFDEGLTAVTVDPGALGPELAALLDREGFRPGDDGAALTRPVVPQG